VVDLEGLMEYLGAKVGVGRVCLFCNGKGKGRYPTIEAVRLHMVSVAVLTDFN
jgi:pre-60S factor REI1